MPTPIEENNVLIRPIKIQYLADNIVGLIILFILTLSAGYSNIYVRSSSIILGTLVFIILSYNLLIMKSTKWIITNEQIVYIRGVFSKQINYIELYRVFDYKESQSLIERLISTKRIVIFSGDKSHPQLSLFGINQKNDVVRLIRERVEINKQIKRVYEISNQ